MHVQPTILARQQMAIGEAQIVEWHWPSPLDITSCEHRHMIEMSIPPMASDGVASFPDVAPGSRARIGGLFVRPAGVVIRSRSVGGRIRIARLAVEPEAFRNLTGAEMPHDEAALQAGLDLRDRSVRWLIARLRDELLAPGFGHAALAEAYATSLAIETARAVAGLAEARREAGRLAGWQERRVRERLAQEGPPPSVAELAALCGVSPRHFARLFSGHAGVAASTQIAAIQLDRAERLLRTSDLPIKEVAARVGFERAGSFSSAFRRATGSSPSDYRKKTRFTT